MRNTIHAESNLHDFRHLHRRAGFGAVGVTDQNLAGNRQQWVEACFDAARRGRELSLIAFDPTTQPRMRDLDAAARKQIRQQRKAQLVALNHAWLRQMATEKAQLREKMTLFWHGHFACQVDHPYAMQDLNNVMRRHALGNFRDLTLAVSRHPAMLEYLNNRQNRKRSPNENFARELMELFTIGRGHYTENDVKEAARAFTGWNFDDSGQFVFRQRQHDFGAKTFRGKTGNWKGEDIIVMLLEDQQTAQFISGKLYRFFVNDIPDAEKIGELAGVMYRSDYDMEAVMRHLLLADWFWDKKNQAARIKSPVELLVGLMRDLHMDLPEAQAVVGLQKLLGQVLFRPPNVAGWPGGRAWIDSSTLLLRMTLPRALLLSSADPGFTLPDDLMDMGTRRRTMKKLRKLDAQIDWRPLREQYAKLPPAARTRHMLADLLPGGQAAIAPNLLDRFTDPRTPNSHISTLCLQILSLPEYQLT